MRELMNKLFCRHNWRHLYNKPIGKGRTIRTFECRKCGRTKKDKVSWSF